MKYAMHTTGQADSSILTQETLERAATSPPQAKTGQFDDPFQLLAGFDGKAEAGCLQISAGEATWSFYLEAGCIRYASLSTQSPTDLGYQLRCLGLNAASDAIKTDAQFRLEFASVEQERSGDAIAQILSWLERREYIDFQQATQIATIFSREALETFFWLDAGEYAWLPPTQLEVTCGDDMAIEALLPEFRERLATWQKLGAKINSFYQRPYLFASSGTATSAPLLEKISKLLRGLSIRQIAAILKQDSLKTAQLLYPHARSGELVMRDPNTPYNNLPVVPSAIAVETVPPVAAATAEAKTRTFKIACIDDSPTILNEMQKFLGAEEYEVTKIDDPVKAPSILFRLRPDLVLMDITMPEINGYKLCSLLRSSTVLCNTPIVMVTGRTGLIDKARAKVTGASGYLTKPFTRGSLLAIVEQYLKG